MVRTLFMHPDTMRELYGISRGIVGDLTQAIRVLETNPTPDNSLPDPGRAGRRELRALGYVVTYALEEKRIVILFVEQE
jgi:hypothetical protein